MYRIENGIFTLVYEGEEGGNNPPPPPPPAPPPENKTFTQEEFNKALAEDRKKHTAQTQKVIQELETLKKSKNLSDQERQNLTTRIEELQTQVMTKDQLLEQQKNKLQTEYQQELHRERGEKESWRNRYTSSMIDRSIVDAAIKEEAYNSDQIIAILQPNTKLVEEVDSEGNGTGVFTPRVKFADTDAEGKPTILDLSVTEAVKRMKEIPERYGNLFKSNVNGGLGGTGSNSSGTKLDLKKLKTYEDYKKIKDKVLKR